MAKQGKHIFQILKKLLMLSLMIHSNVTLSLWIAISWRIVAYGIWGLVYNSPSWCSSDVITKFGVRPSLTTNFNQWHHQWCHHPWSWGGQIVQ